MINWSLNYLNVSPFSMVQLYRGTSLHHVLKLTELMSLLSITWSEVTFLSSSILWIILWTEAGSGVKCLISIWSSFIIISSSSFWQSPSWVVRVTWGQCWCLGNVSAGTHTVWCWYQVFERLSSSVTECELFRGMIYRLLNRSILRTRISLCRASLESWLSTNLRCFNSCLSVNIGLYWIIKEQCILIEIILWFIFANSHLCTHRPAGHL